MIQFFQTMMGKKYYEADIPRIRTSLERIADALEQANRLKSKELEVKDRY